MCVIPQELYRGKSAGCLYAPFTLHIEREVVSGKDHSISVRRVTIEKGLQVRPRRLLNWVINTPCMRH